ncbi:MAG: hypothetical protein BWY02_01931 [bacterium ADurb.Bin157]|nr:MAG: hypothetical protein BWY02_01931 [bacterium ADurb.Bin157]
MRIRSMRCWLSGYFVGRMTTNTGFIILFAKQQRAPPVEYTHILRMPIQGVQPE